MATGQTAAASTPTPATRRAFDDSFKADAVARVKKGETKSEVAKDLDVHVNVLRGWIEKAEDASATPPAEGQSHAPSRGSRISVANAASRASLLETLMAAHGLKVPDSIEVERGAKALMGLGKDLDLEDARLYAATVLSAV